MSLPRMPTAAAVVLTALLVGGCSATGTEGSTTGSATTGPASSAAAPESAPVEPSVATTTGADPTGTDSAGADGTPGIEGVSWTVATYTTETPAEIIVASPPAGTRPLVEMTDGRITLDVGCNDIVGDVAVTADTISATDVTTTDLTCTAPTTEMEVLLTEAFAQPVTYVWNGRALNLTGGDITLNLVRADEGPPTAAVTTG